MDSFCTIIGPFVNIFMVPITNKLRYMMFCRKYVRDMRSKMRELEFTRRDVEEHMNENIRNRFQIPSQVRGWLDEVEGIKANVQNFPSNAIGCFNVNIRHKLGRKALKIIDEIESFTRQNSQITWTNDPIPLGKVDSMKASTSTPSTSTPSTDHRDFQSREETFMEALEALGPNQKSHMIALCGMGGVGKTTMMKRLRNVVHERKMFSYIVEAVIGEKTDPIAIQDAIAEYIGVDLTEKTKPARAEKLRKGFKAKSEGGKNKFFIILDDVWEPVDLEDIGLSALPDQGVDYKVLLTSRDRHVCDMMGVKGNLILNVGLLAEAEAQTLFREFVETSDLELQKIGEEIVSKCCGLPIAIKTMACTLRNKEKDTWNDALSRLKHHDIQSVADKIFETSYNNLQDEETKSLFLLCGLYPEDFNIPKEELVRQGWGMKLFGRADTLRERRNRLSACIERLIHTNLLTESDDVGHVKMHDLVRAFVMNLFLTDDHASIVNHGSMSSWPENDMSGYCKRISLSNRMHKFPGDLKFPNLLILKLMYQKRWETSLQFPENFYGEMEKLQVIWYDNVAFPPLPSSLQCSTNLRVLSLHACLISTNASSVENIGNLLNLEILSFANCEDLERLPSTIGNLKKLKLLDLRNCTGLRVDNGVLRDLVSLEEIYTMVRNRPDYWAVCFTDDDCNELVKRLKNLLALEFEFFNKNVSLKNLSFQNLERFKISVGRWLDGDLMNSFENRLQLAINKDEVLESKVNELFEKTDVLYLSVDGMNDLQDVEVKPSHPLQFSSFYNLRALIVDKCEDLRYLFTLGIAKSLSKLEQLKVGNCPVMGTLIHTEGCGKETIRFPKLKSLHLHNLPKLSGLSGNVNIIELPQLEVLNLDTIQKFTSIYPKNKLATSSFFKEEDVIPKLELISIKYMPDLKELWPCEFSSSEELKLKKILVRKCDNLVNLFHFNFMPLLHNLEYLEVCYCNSIEVLFNIDLDCFGETGKEGGNSNLRIIEVSYCKKLVNLFPCNPMPLMHHLRHLYVKRCNSIEALFDIDLDSIGEIGECGSSTSTGLISIEVKRLENLKEVWRIKGENESCDLIRGFQALEKIEIERCYRFTNVFSPSTVKFVLGPHFCVDIDNYKKWCRYNRTSDDQEKYYKKTITYSGIGHFQPDILG